MTNLPSRSVPETPDDPRFRPLGKGAQIDELDRIYSSYLPVTTYSGPPDEKTRLSETDGSTRDVTSELGVSERKGAERDVHVA